MFEEIFKTKPEHGARLMPPQGAKTDFALCHADLQILSGQLEQKVAKMTHFLFFNRLHLWNGLFLQIYCNTAFKRRDWVPSLALFISKVDIDIGVRLVYTWKEYE